MTEECISTSEDRMALTLYPYRGKALEVGKAIRERYNPHLYMNGYCWSSMLKNYSRSRGNHILRDFYCHPEEDTCVFSGTECDHTKVLLLADTINNTFGELAGWVVETEFDDWDDW